MSFTRLFAAFPPAGSRLRALCGKLSAGAVALAAGLRATAFVTNRDAHVLQAIDTAFCTTPVAQARRRQ